MKIYREFLSDELIKSMAKSFMTVGDKDAIDEFKTIDYLSYIEQSSRSEKDFCQLLLTLFRLVQREVDNNISHVEMANPSSRKNDIKNAMMTHCYWELDSSKFPDQKIINSIKYFYAKFNDKLIVDELICLLVKWIFRVDMQYGGFSIPEYGHFAINYHFSLKTGHYDAPILDDNYPYRDDLNQCMIDECLKQSRGGEVAGECLGESLDTDSEIGVLNFRKITSNTNGVPTYPAV